MIIGFQIEKLLPTLTLICIGQIINYQLTKYLSCKINFKFTQAISVHSRD